jgi:hypothetical protein
MSTQGTKRFWILFADRLHTKQAKRQQERLHAMVSPSYLSPELHTGRNDYALMKVRVFSVSDSLKTLSTHLITTAVSFIFSFHNRK